MTVPSSRKNTVRRLATVAALAPPVLTMAASCTRPHHRPRPDRPDRPTPTMPETTKSTRATTTTAAPVTTLVPETTTTTIVTTTTKAPTTTTTKPTTTTTAAPTPKDYAGKAVTYEWLPGVPGQSGQVQVTITVTGNKITDVKATGPSDPTSKIFNEQDCFPKLRTAVLAAQSADVSVTTAATYTPTAYKASLQDAMDKAGL